jgi:hypothetical protein
VRFGKGNPVRYNSATEAFKLTGIHNINQICRGIRNHKKAGGYFWKYEKDFTEEELALMFPKSQ